MDINAVPLGERALKGILDHVVAVGDEAETSYLEVKSTLDLTATVGIAKVAKFLLGAANRRRREAARYLQGFAVLVIGAEKGHMQGVPRGIEPHELEDRLRPYLGAQFPAFEFGRISISSKREVIFVIAQPPRDGQSIFPCHKNFQNDKPAYSLVDGAIYYRGSSNTRLAKAGEVLDLVERARGGGKPPIKLSVEISGTLRRVEGLREMLNKLYAAREEKFIQRNSEFESSGPPSTSLADMIGRFAQPTSESRARQLVNWKQNRSENLSQGRSHFLGVSLDGVAVRVTSHGRFIARPQLVITFHSCEVLEYREVGHADIEKVVEPIGGRSNSAEGIDFSELRLRPRDYPVDWVQRGGDVEVTLTPESFRPDVPWTSDQDDFVLLPRTSDSQRVRVTWVLTEEGNDEVTQGELEVALSEPLKAVPVLRKFFLRD